MTDTYHIHLPLPPSVNALHGKSKKYRSKQYTKWIDAAGSYWRAQYPHGALMFDGRLRAQFVMTMVDTKDRDIDNYMKASLDFLQGKFYFNDSQVDEVHAVRKITQEGKNRVDIWITKMPDVRHIDLFNQDGAA